MITWPASSEIPVGELEAAATALVTLYEQHKRKANWVALYSVVGPMLANLESIVALAAAQRYPQTATGVHIDWHGERVGEPRNGRSDTVYRRAVLARGIALTRRGETDAFEAAVTVLGHEFGGLTEAFPAKVQVTAYSVPSGMEADLLAMLRTIAADGVGVTLEYSDGAMEAWSLDIDNEGSETPWEIDAEDDQPAWTQVIS